MKEFLLKGFEVELFTGLNSGKSIGVSALASKAFPDFVKEPDQRNIEYITQPEKDYGKIKELLLEPRRRLREWLSLRDLTILPGSTLSLGDSKKFERSDFSNPYHEFIESSYGSKVVTASVHINLGINDLSDIFAALRLVRCEAPLFLSLSASSPFLDGLISGAHSQRWLQFPKTPVKAPLFVNHSEYVTWTEEQLKQGIMWNERHFWASVRPNGVKRPYELNRLELRICDLITDCDLLIAITVLLELRIMSLLSNLGRLDPLKISKFSLTELADLCDKNEEATARNSLDAVLHHWEDGKTITCRDWISKIVEEVTPLAIELNVLSLLKPIREVLEEGNQSMKWLKSFSEGLSIPVLLNDSIQAMVREENLFLKQHIDLGCS